MIYIGSHSTNNLFDSYMGSGRLIIKSIKEFGKENFIKYIIGLYDSKYDAITAEIKIVNKEFVLREDTYNLTTGGQVSPFPMSEETRQKISKACSLNSNKRLIHTEEARKNMSNAQKRRFLNTPVSEETKQKMSKNKKQYYKDNVVSEETKQKYCNTRTGKPIHTEESKHNISIKNKGLIRTEEAKRKMSEAQKQRFLNTPVSEETKIKRRETRKRNLEKKLKEEKGNNLP